MNAQSTSHRIAIYIISISIERSTDIDLISLAITIYPVNIFRVVQLPLPLPHYREICPTGQFGIDIHMHPQPMILIIIICSSKLFYWIISPIHITFVLKILRDLRSKLNIASYVISVLIFQQIIREKAA
ncbi:hypothetical protein D3C71_1333430 [compost metagenome]